MVTNSFFLDPQLGVNERVVERYGDRLKFVTLSGNEFLYSWLPSGRSNQADRSFLAISLAERSA